MRLRSCSTQKQQRHKRKSTMKNPYTKEKIQSIYAGIPDAKLEKTKKTYTIWGIICVVLIYFIPIGVFLFWRTWLISQELRNRTIEKRNFSDPATVPQKTFEPSHYTFADGSKIYITPIQQKRNANITHRTRVAVFFISFSFCFLFFLFLLLDSERCIVQLVCSYQ